MARVAVTCDLLRERAQTRANDKAQRLKDANNAFKAVSGARDRAVDGWQGAVAGKRFDPVLARAWASELEETRVRLRSAGDRRNRAQADYDDALSQCRRAFARTEVAGHLLTAARAELTRRSDESMLMAVADMHFRRGARR